MADLPPTISPSSSWPRRHLGALPLALARAHGQRPFVTFTDGVTGERTELGCATFENWVAKTANLLVEELELEPGSILATALGTHWTAVVIQAAAWRVGAVVALPGAGSGAAATATREGVGAMAGGGPRLLVGAGLGARLTGAANDAVPFAEDVLAYPDDFDDVDRALDDPALLATVDGEPVTCTAADLLSAAAALTGPARLHPGDRFASTVPLTGLAGVLAGPVLALGLGGGLVLVNDTAAGRLPRLLAGERCSALLGPEGGAGVEGADVAAVSVAPDGRGSPLQ